MRIRERATIVTPLRAAALLYPTVLFSWSRSITPVSRHSLSHTRAESFTTHKPSHHKANHLHSLTTTSHTTFIRVLTFPLTIPLCMLVIGKWMLDGNDIKEFMSALLYGMYTCFSTVLTCTIITPYPYTVRHYKWAIHYYNTRHWTIKKKARDIFIFNITHTS